MGFGLGANIIMDKTDVPPAREVPPIVKVSEMLREDAMPVEPRDAVVRARELLAEANIDWHIGSGTREILTELADEVERLRARVQAAPATHKFTGLGGSRHSTCTTCGKSMQNLIHD